MKNRDLKAIASMKEHITNINEYIKQTGFDTFLTSKMAISAVMWELSQLAEESKKISDELKENNKHIKWDDIYRFRNVIIHHYDHVNFEKIWDTLHVDIPSLENDIECIYMDLIKEN